MNLKLNVALPVVALASAAVVALTGSLTASVSAKKVEQIKMNPIVEFDTDKGVVKAIIYKRQAPKTSDNFLDLVNRGFYNGLTFHRYEPGFVIQGGDPKGNGSGNFNDPKLGHDRFIDLEKVSGLTHDQAGMLAMARTSEPNSASCQFYFTLAPASFLDKPPGYAVFGKVIEGLEVVQKLRAGDHMTKVFEVSK